MLKNFHIIAFTHRNLPVEKIGKLHISPDDQELRLKALQQQLQLDELMFLSTCNRVEFFFVSAQAIDQQFLSTFFQALYPEFSAMENEEYVQQGELFSDILAVQHTLAVASSIDSMVVGEREIITQVRSAFEACRSIEITGDFLRILMRHTIETAKRVYTETSIAKKPVSVVSLAYHKLRDMNIPLDARVLIVGAGVTNTNMGRFLKKHGFKNFVVFNRTYSKAEQLAQELNGKAYPLQDLEHYRGGFDILMACTGTDIHLISEELYGKLLQGDADKKVVIDIALPQDLHPAIIEQHRVTHISVNELQKISSENLKERSKEIQHVEDIIGEALFEFQSINKLREVEKAMREVPQKVKDIRSAALNEVFKNDLAQLDDHSKEVLDKVINYMEKKYMSMPMLMAKEILLKQ